MEILIEMAKVQNVVVKALKKQSISAHLASRQEGVSSSAALICGGCLPKAMDK